MTRFTIRDAVWLAISVLAMCVATCMGYRLGKGMQRAQDNLELSNAKLMVEQAQTRLKREGLPPLYDAMKD